MSNPSQQIIQKLWNHCNVLRADGCPTATTWSSSRTALEQFEASQTELARR